MGGSAVPLDAPQQLQNPPNAKGDQGRVKWLLAILDGAIRDVPQVRWAKGVVGVVAAALVIACLISPNPIMIASDAALVFLGMYALRLFPDEQSRTVEKAKTFLTIVITILIAIAMTVVVLTFIGLGLRHMGLNIPGFLSNTFQQKVSSHSPDTVQIKPPSSPSPGSSGSSAGLDSEIEKAMRRASDTIDAINKKVSMMQGTSK